MHARYWRSAAAVILLASTAACAGSGAPKAQSTPTVDSPRARMAPKPIAGLHLPIEDYMPSPSEIYEENSAWVAVITACLKRYGITNSTPTPAFRGPKTLLELRYGTSDVDWASRYGYWMPGDDRPAPSAPSPHPDEAKLMTGVVRTYAGKAVPTGGCVQEARASTSGDPDISSARYNQLINVTSQLASKTFRLARKQQTVRRTEEAWSACMKAEGYSFPADVFAASDSLQLPAQRPAPAKDSKEVATAAADSRCVQKSGVIQAWFAAEAKLQKKAISQKPAEWAKLRQSYRAREANVIKILRNLKTEKPQ
ncbi:hypothetical protein ACGF8D_30230 [Streptomyces massasporeus]|uniref:hypothetical protein n=1 Tax=Streptomyces massasporeus TaxID=67324 RepID=UPI0037203C9E